MKDKTPDVDPIDALSNLKDQIDALKRKYESDLAKQKEETKTKETKDLETFYGPGITGLLGEGGLKLSKPPDAIQSYRQKISADTETESIDIRGNLELRRQLREAKGEIVRLNHIVETQAQESQGKDSSLRNVAKAAATENDQISEAQLIISRRPKTNTRTLVRNLGTIFLIGVLFLAIFEYNNSPDFRGAVTRALSSTQNEVIIGALILGVVFVYARYWRK